MKHTFSLPAALACSLLIHLAPVSVWFLVMWAAPAETPVRKPLALDDIGIIAMREQEARTGAPPLRAAPPALPTLPAPPAPKPKPRPPRPRPAAVVLPEPPPAAVSPAPPPREAKEEERRVAQRMADREKLEQAISEQYRREMKQRVERNLRYPLAARLAGETGNTGVRFSIAPDGSVRSAAVKKSSGHPDLDAAALDAIRRSSPFPSPPFEREMEFSTTFNFDEVKGKAKGKGEAMSRADAGQSN
ncbi:MAG: energy transducer TonB [Azoarcus sp.]|jgi:protein TonB|nr:energy transducer TonB [Azoarcus sp.]